MQRGEGWARAYLSNNWERGWVHIGQIQIENFFFLKCVHTILQRFELIVYFGLVLLGLFRKQWANTVNRNKHMCLFLSLSCSGYYPNVHLNCSCPFPAYSHMITLFSSTFCQILIMCPCSSFVVGPNCAVCFITILHTRIVATACLHLASQQQSNITFVQT